MCSVFEVRVFVSASSFVCLVRHSFEPGRAQLLGDAVISALTSRGTSFAFNTCIAISPKSREQEGQGEVEGALGYRAACRYRTVRAIRRLLRNQWRLLPLYSYQKRAHTAHHVCIKAIRTKAHVEGFRRKRGFRTPIATKYPTVVKTKMSYAMVHRQLERTYPSSSMMCGTCQRSDYEYPVPGHNDKHTEKTTLLVPTSSTQPVNEHQTQRPPFNRAHYKMVRSIYIIQDIRFLSFFHFSTKTKYYSCKKITQTSTHTGVTITIYLALTS